MDAVTVTREHLEALAEGAEGAVGDDAQVAKRKGRNAVAFDVEKFLAGNNISYSGPTPYKNDGAVKFVLETCPFKPDHHDRAAFLIRDAKGYVVGGCHHSSCKGKNIRRILSAIDPNYKKSEHFKDLSHEAGFKSDEKESQATKIVGLTEDMLLFHEPGSDPRTYASFQVGNHRECLRIGSSAFERLLRKRFWDEFESSPKAQDLKDAMGILDAKAIFDGPEHNVYLRYALKDEKVYVDLCDADWEVVEISSDGWRILAESPVFFRRTQSMEPLPRPVAGGSVRDLDQFIRASGVDSTVLLLAFIIGAMHPIGPFVILVLTGEQGAAKSSVTAFIAALVDPRIGALRSAPTNERDLAISAENTWILALDNLSYLPPWLADALCRLATGAAFRTRKLYTDGEEYLIVVRRPVVINGIEDLATRSDLLDRSVLVTIAPMSEEERKEESKIWGEFLEARPRILGALYSAISMALARIHSIDIPRLPRMADFAKWAVAAEPALGVPAGAFLAAYCNNKLNADQIALASSEVACALQRFILKRRSWTGSCEDLLAELNALTTLNPSTRRSWPKSPSALSNVLRRLAPNLRRHHIEIEFPNRSSCQRSVSVRGDIVPLALSFLVQSFDPSKLPAHLLPYARDSWGFSTIGQLEVEDIPPEILEGNAPSDVESEQSFA